MAAAQVHCWADNHWVAHLTRELWELCLHRNRGRTRCEHVVAGIRHDAPSTLLSVSTQFPDISALSRYCSHPFYPVVLSRGRCEGNRSECTAVMGGRLFGPGGLSPSRPCPAVPGRRGDIGTAMPSHSGEISAGLAVTPQAAGRVSCITWGWPPEAVWVTCRGCSPRVTYNETLFYNRACEGRPPMLGWPHGLWPLDVATGRPAGRSG